MLTTYSKKEKKTDNASQTITINKTKSELIQRKWKATKYTIDGLNIVKSEIYDYLICSSGDAVYYTDKINSDIYYTFKTTTYEAEVSYTTELIDYDFSYDYCDAYYDYDNETYLTSQSWKLSIDETKLILTNDDNTTSTFDVLLLDKTNLTFSGTLQGQSIYVELLGL